MTERFGRDVVSVAFFCEKCERTTQHRIENGKKGPCMSCLLKLDQLREGRRKRQEEEIAEKQERLFE